MTTRVNTKFVILLVALLLLGGGACYVVATRFLFKDAETYAKIGADAMADGNKAKAAGGYEAANSFFSRAAQNYNNAYQKDRDNAEYLRGSIVANTSVICTQRTEAQNRLNLITNAVTLIHDMPGASTEDRQAYYDLMFQRHRRGLRVDGFLPWLARVKHTCDANYDADPSDSLARRWRGISEVYLLRNDMSEEERAVPLEDLQSALEESPDDPFLLHHVARWRLNEAQRIRAAAGGEVTPASAEQFELCLETSEQSYRLAPEDPYVAFSHLTILYATPLDDALPEQLAQALLPLAEQLISSADARSSLYPSELSRVVSWLSDYDRTAGQAQASVPPVEPEGHEENRAKQWAVDIAAAAVKDNPDNIQNHSLHAQALSLIDNYDSAILALRAGLAIDRPLGPTDYLLDQQTRLLLHATLADTYLTQAAFVTDDQTRRDAILGLAHQALDNYRSTGGAEERAHVARALVIAGRAAMLQNNAQAAVNLLEEANEIYGSIGVNLQSLIFLARAHDANGNGGKAAEYYEQVLGLEPRLRTERLRLVRLYIDLGGAALETAHDHINEYLKYNPEDRQAWLVKASIFVAAGQYAQAADTVEQLGLENNPTLVATYASYLAQAGNPDEALRLLRERLADDANDLRAIRVLLSLIPAKEQRLTELTTLEANGLAEEVVRQYRTLIESGGRVTIDNLTTLTEGQDGTSLDTLTQVFALQWRDGTLDEARATLDKMAEVAPTDRQVLTWQFSFATNDKDWARADRLIDQMMALSPATRPEIAANDGAFLRAQVLTGRVGAETPAGQAPDYQEVIRAYRRALEDAATYVPGWIALGKLYAAQEDWPLARDAFSQAYQIQPTNTQAIVQLARVLRQTQETARSLELYRDAARRQPSNRQIQEEYLRAEARFGHRERAIEQRLERRDSDPADMRNRGALAAMLAEDARYDEAIVEANSIIEAQGLTRPTALGLASIHALREQVPLGIQVIEGYIQARGDQVESSDYAAFGNYLAQYGRLAEAEAAYQQAISLEDPATRAATRQWADLLARTRRPADAAQLYRQLLGEFPDDDPLKMELARVYLMMGNHGQAREILRGAAPSPGRGRLLARAEMQQGNIQAALEIVRASRQDFPDNTALEGLEGELLSRLGAQSLNDGEIATGRRQLEEALAIYESVVQRNPSLYEHRVVMARLENRLGRREQAISRLLRILDEEPGQIQARSALYSFYINEAVSYLPNDPRRQQLAESAYDALNPLIELHPDNAQILRQAGRSAAEAGKFRASARHYKDAFAISDEMTDLVGLIDAQLSARQLQDVLTLLEGDEYTEHLAASPVLRAMQAQALADTGQTSPARNLFSSLLRRTKNPEEVDEILDRLLRSSLLNESFSIVGSAIPEDQITPAIDLKLASVAQATQQWQILLDRLNKYEGQATGDAAILYEIHLLRGTTYQQTGGQDNLLRAKQIYEFMLSQFGENTEVLNNLAYLLSEQLAGEGNAQRAVAYAQQAIGLLPENTSALHKAQFYDTLGWAQFHAHDLAAAQATLRQSIAFSPLSVNNKHLGLVYLEADDGLQASRYFNDARRAARAAGNTDEIAEIDRLIADLRQTP